MKRLKKRPVCGSLVNSLRKNVAPSAAWRIQERWTLTSSGL